MLSGHSNFDSVIIITICVCIIYYKEILYRHEEFLEISPKYTYYNVSVTYYIKYSSLSFIYILATELWNIV
jgi:hypothetical protein